MYRNLITIYYAIKNKIKKIALDFSKAIHS